MAITSNIHPWHYKRLIQDESKRYTDDQDLLNKQLTGGDHNGVTALNMSTIESPYQDDIKDKDGYWYFLNGHSSYGGKDKVGP